MSDKGKSAAEASRLREALLDLCAERGFADVSLEELLSRAEVSEEYFSRSYPDLEGFFCSVYLAERDRMLRRVGAACRAQPQWRLRLRAAAYAVFSALRADPRVAHLVMVDALTAGERAKLSMEEGLKAMIELVDEGRPDGSELSDSTAQLVVAGIFAQLYAAVGQGKRLREELVPQMIYSAILPYLGEEAAEEELHARKPLSTQPGRG